MSRRREVPDDIVEDESILDDIGEDEDYSDDDDFDEEEIPPLEISSARRNRPPTATRRAEVSPSGGLATPPPSALFGGDTLQRRLDTESDEDPYRDEEPFEREDNESPLATHEPMITLTRSPLEGGAPLPLSASVANAAMLSPEISGMMNVATRSVTSDSTADDDYDHVEAFDLFDTTTQSHHQMYDIVTALLASSSEESANVMRSAGGGTISSSYGGAQHSTTAASSTTTASPPIDLHYRRQQEISKKRAELLGALYRPAYQLSILSADESEMSGIVPPFLASLQAALQDFVASPLFSSSECAELLLGPIIHKGGNPVGLKALPPSLLSVLQQTMQASPQTKSIVEASVASLIVILRHKDSLLNALVADATRDEDAGDEVTHSQSFSSIAERWGWLHSLFTLHYEGSNFLAHEKFSKSIFSDLTPHFAAFTVFERFRLSFPVDTTWSKFLRGVSIPAGNGNDEAQSASAQFWSSTVLRMFEMISSGQLIPPVAGTQVGSGGPATKPGKQLFKQLVKAMVGHQQSSVETAVQPSSSPHTTFTTPRVCIATVAVEVLQHRIIPLARFASMKSHSTSSALEMTMAVAAITELRRILPTLDFAGVILEKSGADISTIATACCGLYVSLHRLLVRAIPLISASATSVAASARKCIEFIVTDIPTVEVLCETKSISDVVSSHEWTDMIKEVTENLVFPAPPRERAFNASAHVLSLLMSAITHYYEHQSALNSLTLLETLSEVVSWAHGVMDRQAGSTVTPTPTSVLVIQNDVVLTLNSLLANGLLQAIDGQHLADCCRFVLVTLASAVDSSKHYFVELSAPVPIQHQLSSNSGNHPGKTFQDALESSQRRRNSMLPMAASAVFSAPTHSNRSPPESENGDDPEGGNISSSPRYAHAAWLDGVNPQNTVLSFAALSITNLLQISGDKKLTSSGESLSSLSEVLNHVFDLIELLLFPSELLLERRSHQAISPPPALTAGSMLSMDEESTEELTDRVVVSAVLLIGSMIHSAGQQRQALRLTLNFAVGLENHIESSRSASQAGRGVQRRRSSGGHAESPKWHARAIVPPFYFSPLLADVVARVLLAPLQQLLETFVPSDTETWKVVVLLGITSGRLIRAVVDDGASRYVGDPPKEAAFDAAHSGTPRSRFFGGSFAKLYETICLCLTAAAAEGVILEHEASALEELLTVLFDRNSSALCARLHERAFAAVSGSSVSSEQMECVIILRHLLNGVSVLLSSPTVTASCDARAILLNCDTPRILATTWRSLATQKHDMALITHVDYCTSVASFFDSLFATTAKENTSAETASNLRRILDDVEMLWHREVLPWTILEVGRSNVLLPLLQAIRDERNEMMNVRRLATQETVSLKSDSSQDSHQENAVRDRFELLNEKLRFAGEQESTARLFVENLWYASWETLIAKPHSAFTIQRATVISFLDDLVGTATSAANKPEILVAVDEEPINTLTRSAVDQLLEDQRALFALGEGEARRRSEILVEAVLVWQVLATEFESRLEQISAARESNVRTPPPQPLDVVPSAQPANTRSAPTSPPIPLSLLMTAPTSPISSILQPTPLTVAPTSATELTSTTTESIVNEFDSTMEAATQALLSSSHPTSFALLSSHDEAPPADHHNNESTVTPPDELTFSPLVYRHDESRTLGGDCELKARAPSARGVSSFEDECTPTATLLLRMENLMDSINIEKSGARQPQQVDACLSSLRDAKVRSSSVDVKEKHRASRITDDLESIKSNALIVIRAIDARERLLNELHEFVAKFERNQQFFSAGLVDSMIASSLQDIKSASIKVVEATHAWRAANREYYNRWSLVRPVDNDAPPPAIFFGDGSPDGNGSLLLPPSHSMIVGDWSQNFNNSKTGPGGDASGSFFQAWKGGDKAANSIGMNGPHAASNVSMASSRRTHQASSPVTTAAPTIFLYKGVHYLHKMKEDLNFLSSSGVASYLHVEVNHNVVLMDKKRVVEETITEPNCRGRNFFARLSAPKGTLAISRAAGHLDPDEYGIKELQKAAEDERSINVWFRSQTAAERQVVPPPPSKHRGPRAPTFNLFKVVVPHNWRRALEEEQSHVLPARPLSALAGPSSIENRSKHVHLQSKRSPPSRPLSAALTRKEMQAAADKEAFDSQMQMFESLSKTQPIEHQSLMTVSKLRNRVKSIHGRVPSSADYQTRLTRRHPLQRFATVDAPNDQWLQSNARHSGDSNHPAGRAAAAAVGLRPPSASLHISLVASGLAVPSTVKARRGSIIEGARYSSTHLSASVSSYRGPVSNATTPVPSARSFNHTQSFRAHPLPPGWDGMFAVILGILFYRKVRQRALERCSATKVQKWYRRCRAQALCGKMIEDALAANSELMAWLMSLAESQRRRGSKAPPVPPSPGSVVSSNPHRSSAIPRYSNAMQLFRYYSVAATKIQRQYRGRLRRITMLNMIGKLIAVLKMQRWARNMLDAMRLLRAAYLMRVGKSILKWMRLCRLRAAAREFRRRQWCAIHIQRFYRIARSKALLRTLKKRHNAAIDIQRVVRGWRGRNRAKQAHHVATVLKFIKAKLWYRHLAQSFLHHEVSRRLKLAMSRTQSQKELERRKKEKAQNLRIYLKIDESVVHRRAAARILAVYRGWHTRKVLVETFTQQSQQMRQFASHTDTIAEGFHSMVGTSSASSVVAAPYQRSKKAHILDTNSVATSTAHTRRQDDPGATWALARRLVREYTPIVVVLQCFFRKTLARMMLTRLRYEKKTRDVYLQAWKYNSKRLRMFREHCTNKGRDAFMAALRRSQERREQERRRREELARQHRLLREKSATLIQSMWRMFTTQQDFLEARDKHAQFREEANTAEFIVNGIVGIQRLVRHFLWMCKWSRVMRIREYYSARMIQMKWRKVLRRREELEAMYRHAHRVAEAAFKIQVWYRALSASKKFRDEYDSDDDE